VWRWQRKDRRRRWWLQASVNLGLNSQGSSVGDAGELKCSAAFILALHGMHNGVGWGADAGIVFSLQEELAGGLGARIQGVSVIAEHFFNRLARGAGAAFCNLEQIAHSTLGTVAAAVEALQLQQGVAVRGYHALTNFGIGVTAAAVAVVTIPRVQADNHSCEILERSFQFAHFNI